MKNISKIIAISAIAFASVVSVTAQAADKMAYVNTGVILQKLPQMKQLQQKLEAQSKTKRTELDKTEKMITDKMAKLEREGPTMKKADAQKLFEEIQADKANFGKKMQESQKALADIERTEMTKINEKIQTAINSVAKSGGYDFVFNGQALAYATQTADITDAVYKQIK